MGREGSDKPASLSSPASEMEAERWRALRRVGGPYSLRGAMVAVAVVVVVAAVVAVVAAAAVLLLLVVVVVLLLLLLLGRGRWCLLLS